MNKVGTSKMGRAIISSVSSERPGCRKTDSAYHVLLTLIDLHLSNFARCVDTCSIRLNKVLFRESNSSYLNIAIDRPHQNRR